MRDSRSRLVFDGGVLCWLPPPPLVCISHSMMVLVSRQGKHSGVSEQMQDSGLYLAFDGGALCRLLPPPLVCILRSMRALVGGQDERSGASEQMMRDGGLRLTFDGCVSMGVRCADYSGMHLAFDKGVGYLTGRV